MSKWLNKSEDYVNVWLEYGDYENEKIKNKAYGSCLTIMTCLIQNSISDLFNIYSVGYLRNYG